MSIEKAPSVPRFGGPSELTPEDQERARGLRKMRTLALSLLILATLIFLSTHIFTDNTGIWGFVSRASEAAMIGAIADWFAVTALFRHPLGLHIPHTAIIPRKKDTLGASMSAFVAANFLHAEAVSTKIRSAQVSRRAGEWLSRSDNRDLVVDRAAGGLEYVLARINDESVVALTRNVIIPRLVATRKTPVLAQLLRQIVLDGAHHKLVDLIVAEAYSWLSDNPQVIDEIVHNRAPSWVPDFVNEQLSNRLQREVLGWVADVRDNEYHKARQALDAWLVDLSDDLNAETPLSEKAEVILNDLLSQSGVVDSVLEIWTSLKQLLRQAIIDPDGEVRGRISELIGEFAQRLQNDSDFAATIDDRIATTAGDLAESFGPEIASVISDTIERWDAKEASERIELYVGKDLQYIRINGTVIGALVGLVIHTIIVLLP
ncbi:MAG: DUF445 domain-containing protein [Brevibacterium sp.]|uniref:DUF445 domain-containing protein n=1 Tax=Brevibacterium sp. TaxID=1701 RepID=UPI00264A4B9B|nr:DUF445 domain-containing protein [Brevibacterium sp.]MDN5807372.1 DUF445 domain-containing protein [Brevibacterium sp.]MDN5834258.1 DUF445 domain-containing protein [Brevibacterium sp.]MDN5876200.1 DUF445 domain-containing protein [Brevibacterium sp.]MDN5908212.1 DUF445 domain-containing protein [Brevibacterium sp.]MDN6134590.1 DUF445 domain-containing protein [Brevibacterium sp.]